MLIIFLEGERSEIVVLRALKEVAGQSLNMYRFLPFYLLYPFMLLVAFTLFYPFRVKA